MEGLCIRPRQQLLDLARAGAFGDHESNIERDVLRRSFGSLASCLNVSMGLKSATIFELVSGMQNSAQVPLTLVPVPVRTWDAKSSAWQSETRTFISISH